MTTAMYAVDGIICESCKAAVLEHVQSLSGVSVAAMDLFTGGQLPLIVTSGTKLGAGAVRDAVENAGFELTSAGGPATALVPPGRRLDARSSGPGPTS